MSSILVSLSATRKDLAILDEWAKANNTTREDAARHLFKLAPTPTPSKSKKAAEKG